MFSYLEVFQAVSPYDIRTLNQIVAELARIRGVGVSEIHPTEVQGDLHTMLSDKFAKQGRTMDSSRNYLDGVVLTETGLKKRTSLIKANQLHGPTGIDSFFFQA